MFKIEYYNLLCRIGLFNLKVNWSTDKMYRMQYKNRDTSFS